MGTKLIKYNNILLQSKLKAINNVQIGYDVAIQKHRNFKYNMKWLITWRLFCMKPGQSYCIFWPITSATCSRICLCFVTTKSCFFRRPFFRDSFKGGCLYTLSQTYCGCSRLHQYSCMKVLVATCLDQYKFY